MELRLPWLLNRILAEPDTGFSPFPCYFWKSNHFSLCKFRMTLTLQGLGTIRKYRSPIWLKSSFPLRKAYLIANYSLPS